MVKMVMMELLVMTHVVLMLIIVMEGLDGVVGGADGDILIGL